MKIFRKRQKSIKQLPKKLKKILNKEHDYGSICEAFVDCLKECFKAINDHPQAGITGFQASYIMLTFYGQMTNIGQKVGFKVISYDDLLYPQLGDRFDKTLKLSTWELLQKVAKENLDSNDRAHLDVIAHWQSIVDGLVPHGFRILQNEEETK